MTDDREATCEERLRRPEPDKRCGSCDAPIFHAVLDDDEDELCADCED